MSTEPVTHLEQVVAGTTTPVTHLEQVVAGTATPVTHLEHVISENSGGGGVTVTPLSVSENGTYTAPSGTAYSPVTVDVPTGGGALHGVTNLSVYSADDNHTEVAGIFPDLEILNLPSNNDNTLEKIDLQSNKTVSIVSGCGAANRGGALREIDFHMGQATISSPYGLRYIENLETVLAKCIVTTANTGNQFIGSHKLKTIYFLENAQDISVDISGCPLDDASLVSLANGLKLGATSSTLKLSAAAKATAQAMLGTVSTVGSGADAYDLFTPDATGSTTLAQFITTSKGWTIA